MRNPVGELFKIHPPKVNLGTSFCGKAFWWSFGLWHKYIWKCSFLQLCIFWPVSPIWILPTGSTFLVCKEMFRLEKTCCVAALHLFQTPCEKRELNNKVVLLSLLVSPCQFWKQSCWLRSSVGCWVAALGRSFSNACEKLSWHINTHPNNACKKMQLQVTN